MEIIKKIITILMFILMLIAFENVVYAANEALLTLTPAAESYKQGEQAILKVSLTNTGIEGGVSMVAGIFEYDNTVFELIPKDIAELTEEQQMIIELLAEELGFAEVLSVTDNYLLLVTEGNLIVMNIGEKLEIGKTEEVGEIKFQILDSASNGNKTIKLTSATVEEEYKMQDVSTTISIGQVSSGGTSYNDPKDEEKDENTETPTEADKDNSNGEEEEPKKENQDTKKENEQKDKDEAKQDIVYTGVEDVIPFIAIILIIAIVSYIKYKKYKYI